MGNAPAFPYETVVKTTTIVAISLIVNFRKAFRPEELEKQKNTKKKRKKGYVVMVHKLITPRP